MEAHEFIAGAMKARTFGQQQQRTQTRHTFSPIAISYWISRSSLVATFGGAVGIRRIWVWVVRVSFRIPYSLRT